MRDAEDAPTRFTRHGRAELTRLRRVDVRTLPTREAYDLWAARYDSSGTWLGALEGSATAHALGDVHGLHVLDAGCGTGRHAIPMASAGAQVTAVDVSSEMLARARAKSTAVSVRFVLADLTSPLPFRSAIFDGVLSALVLEHLPAPQAFFGELGRVTRPGGRIVITAMHPAMLELGASAAFRLSSYEEIRPHSYKMSLQQYVDAVERAGLVLETFDEYAPDEAFSAQFPYASPYIGVPALLVMHMSPAGR